MDNLPLDGILPASDRTDMAPPQLRAQRRITTSDLSGSPPLAFPSADQIARALQRVRAQTTLPESRVNDIFATALRDAHEAPSIRIDPIERAVMIATQRLWSEEKSAGRST